MGNEGEFDGLGLEEGWIGNWTYRPVIDVFLEKPCAAEAPGEEA
jgi:hypothetical protein